VGRELGQQFRGDGLPVEALLQHIKTLHPPLAQDQKLAVNGALQIETLDQVGKSTRDVLAGARIDASREPPVSAAAGHRLHTDAIPLPFAHEVGSIELGEVLLLKRVRQHGRPEGGGIARFRPWPATLDPGEQVLIGRLQPVPDLLDLVWRDGTEAGDGSLGQARRDAHTGLARDELQERPAPGLVERVEPAGDEARQVNLVGRGEPLHHLRQGRHMRRVVVADPYFSLSRGEAGLRPHEGDRLGEVADVVPGQVKQGRVHALLGKASDQARLSVPKGQAARQRGERPASLRVGRMGKIIGHEPDLGVAARLI
jgi:hypothetical protein